MNEDVLDVFVGLITRNVKNVLEFAKPPMESRASCRDTIGLHTPHSLNQILRGKWGLHSELRHKTSTLHSDEVTETATSCT